MIRHRSLIAVVCIAAMLVTALVPATWDLLGGILVPLDPLFGIVGPEARVVIADSIDPRPFPYLDTLDSRGPPVV